MTVVGEATVIVKYDSAVAEGDLDAQIQGDLAGVGDAAAAAGTVAGEDLRDGLKDSTADIGNDMADAGALAGANLRESVSDETEKIPDDMKSVGQDAGAALKDGTKVGAADLANDLGNAGLLAGQEVRGKVTEGADGLSEDLGKVADDGGKALEDGLGKGKLASIEDALGTLGISMGGVHDRATTMGKAAEQGGFSIKHMADNAGLSEAGFLAVGGGIAAVAAASLDLGAHLDTATTAVANSAQISVAKAGEITKAFSGMAGTSENDGAALATAYATVAGQLGSIQGRALTASEAVHVMTAAQNLAEASGTDLTGSTQTLAGVMQAYQIPAKDAASVTDQLYVAGNRTGLGVTGLGAALAKVRSGLGDMAPSLGQTNGLLLDMADHGETGRKGLSLLTSAMTTLVKPSADLATAQQEMKSATAGLDPALKSLAEQYENGQITAKDLTTATDGMTGSQTAAWAAFIKAKDAQQTAKQATDALGFSTVDAQGKFIGIGAVLEHLQQQTRGMSDEQATAKLTADGFGSSAAKMLTIVQAGPGAFQKATEAVEKHGSAAAAAAKQQDEMGAKAKILETDLEDLGESIGAVLLPPLGDMASVGVDVADFLEKTPPLAYALGAAVGIGLGVPVARFAYGTAKDFIGSLASGGEAIVNFGAKMLGQEPVFAATQAAEEETAAALRAAAESMSASADQIAASMATIGSATAAATEEADGQLALFDASVRSSAAVVDETAPEVAAGFDTMLGPIGLVAGAIGGLIGAFSLLGGHEETEADYANAVTSAKNRETSAIQAATSATIAAAGAGLGAQQAEQEHRQAVEAASAALQKYGASSSQYKSALLTERQSLIGVEQARDQATQADEKSQASQAKAVSQAQAQVQASQKEIDAGKAQMQLVEETVRAYGNTGSALQTLLEKNQQYQQGEQEVTDGTKAHQQALQALAGAQTTAAANELNYQHNMQGSVLMSQQEQQKVQALGSVFDKLPKNVQTKIAADSTDALNKISGLVSKLQPIVGTAEIVKIIGDSSNAQQAISNLTNLLQSLPAEFTTIGEQADQGLAIGLRAGIPGVSAASQDVANAATSSAKKAHDSHSPSRVFHKIGEDAGEGLAQGLEASRDRVQDATRRMIGEVTVGDRTLNLPVRLAPGPGTPNLEAVGAPGTAADARNAPSTAMANAEQAWVTAAQTLVTNITSAVTNTETKVQTDSESTASAAQKRAKDGEARHEASLKNQESIASRGQAQLSSLVSAITSGSQQDLNTALSGLTERHMVDLVQKLDSTHNTALRGMASEIETTWKQGMDELAKQNEITANTLAATVATDSASAFAKVTADSATMKDNALTAATQQSTDFTQLAVDAATELGQSVAKSAAGQQQQITQALAENQAQVAAGMQLTATQAATQLDEITRTQDAAVAARQAKLDADTLSSDKTVGRDQERLDKAKPNSLEASFDAKRLADAQAAQQRQEAIDNALLAAAQAQAAAAEQTAKNTATLAAQVAGAGGGPSYTFYLEGSGQTTTADWINEIGIAMTVGTLPAAVANPSLPGNAALVAA